MKKNKKKYKKQELNILLTLNKSKRNIRANRLKMYVIYKNISILKINFIASFQQSQILK